MMECIIDFNINCRILQVVFLGDEQLYAAEALVVLEQVVCYMPDIIHQYETL